MDRPVSEELRALLSRQNAPGQTAGTVQPAMMKWANDLADREDWGDEDHSPSGGEELRPNGMKPGRLRIYRARPFLAVVEGGRR